MLGEGRYKWILELTEIFSTLADPQPNWRFQGPKMISKK
jgi:hypothetical protein